MMEKFKELFSRQDRNSSPASEPEEETMEMRASIILAADQNNENFVSVDFCDGEQLKIAELMFLFASGTILSNLVDSLKEACESEQELATILSVFTELLTEHAKNIESAAVIDPTEVFSRGERSEYKG